LSGGWKKLLDSNNYTDYAVAYKGNVTALGKNSPSETVKTWWENTANVPKLSILAAYNNSGSEKTMIFSKGNANNTYGTVLAWGYADKYIRILRKSTADTWLSSDWEKIDAGYADSAGTATSAGKWTTAQTLTIGNKGQSVDGSSSVSWSLAEIGAAPAVDGGYLPLSGGTLTGPLSKDNYILTPDKYFASASGTKKGAIKITLPVSWTATMMFMKIDIYNYNNNNAITYTVGGYNHTDGGGYWTNCSAQCSGFGDKSNLAVRFGHDGSKCCIIIGETDTSWSYPKVLIRNIILGHSGTTLSKWTTGWNIEWITTLPTNIDVTKTDVNITSDYPTKTGVGASGTWGINISGSAGGVAWSNVSGRPTDVSSFTNDAGYLTSETDPTVPAWAKAASKPSYTASEVGAAPAVTGGYLPLSGGIMTGNIRRYYSTASTEPLITALANNLDIYLW
jgi:hypothetical protein